MTVDELKAEALKLPTDARIALAEWIACSDDVRAFQRAELIRDLEPGLAQADRGELIEAHEVFARLRAAQRAKA
jgi:predicted transcriptional regulator